MSLPVAGPGGCGIAAPVLLRAILPPDGGRIAVDPPALMGCALAVALAHWLITDVAPEIAAGGDRLARVAVAGSYECRGRNRVAEARMSEHATGNALDIAAFVTARGERHEIARQSAGKAFFQALQRSACLRFMTVLGPGSDGFHETHLHVDLQIRANGSHYCHWLID